MPPSALFRSSDLTLWQRHRRAYPQALEQQLQARFSKSKQPDADRGRVLEIDARVVSRCAAGPVSAARLVEVVEWKLSKGTFRPGLLQKAQSNTEAKVKAGWTACCDAILQQLASGQEEHTALDAEVKALSLDADLYACSAECRSRAAAAGVKALSKDLFGVGPATASAVLCGAVPELVAFMSDEAMLAAGLAKDKKSLKYDLSTFRKFNDLLQAKAAELSGTATPRASFTGEDVQKALFAESALGGKPPEAGSSSQASRAQGKRGGGQAALADLHARLGAGKIPKSAAKSPMKGAKGPLEKKRRTA